MTRRNSSKLDAAAVDRQNAKVRRERRILAPIRRMKKEISAVPAVSPIILILPWPPSVNHYYRPGERVGQRFIMPAGKAYRLEVWQPFVASYGRKAAGRLSVTITAFPPDKRRRDLDNLLKCLLDALQHAGCYDDDEQIDLLTIERREVVPGGRLWVRIAPMVRIGAAA